MHITRQALVYLLLAWVAPPVLAEETALHVNVPTQSLARALDSLAQQAHLQIIYNPDALGDQSSRAVVGTYTPRDKKAPCRHGIELYLHRGGHGSGAGGRAAITAQVRE